MNSYQQISFNRLRKIIGWLGLSMPLALLAYTLPASDCNEVMNSISTYFHTKAGHVFAAISFFIGVVLYNTIKYPEDKWLYRIAAVLAVVIGFVPNKQEADLGGCLIRENGSTLLNNIHFAAAIAFFALLSYLVYFRFTKYSPELTVLSAEKTRRNKIFKWCGSIMMVSMAAILVYWYLDPKGWAAFKPIFVGETIMLIAFSIAWLVKGQFWVKDKEN